ncbi:MAG: hypothetical protein IPH54_22340 [Rhodoferax sp.]|nr:hypothetical protein [Rhodoferax sp.]
MLVKLIIPQSFENRTSDTPIRTWTTGCSTGEEAYSLAILLRGADGGAGAELLGAVRRSDVDSRVTG